MMRITGLQKFTLIDYPGKIACTLFMQGCNFRCGFCHNPELVIDSGSKNYDEKEILDFLEKRKKQLEAVCITGGEPLISLDLDFLKKIKKLGYFIKIDTNGSFPGMLKKLLDLKLLDYVAMDIKASKEKYKEITNSNVDLSKIEESIRLVASLENYEFRTTIIEGKHSEDEIEKMMRWMKNLTGKKLKNFSLQGFKNSGKLLNESFKKEKNTSEKYLEDLKRIAEKYFENVEIMV